MSKTTIWILSMILILLGTTIAFLTITSNVKPEQQQSVEKLYTSADISTAYNNGYEDGEKTKLPYVEQVNSLQITINTLTEEKTSLQNRLTTAQNEITVLQNSITNKDLTINQLNNRITTLVSQVETLNQDKEQLSANIQSLNAQIEDLTLQNEQLQGLVDADLAQQISELESENSSLRSQISSLQNTTIPALQQQLNSFKTWCKNNLYIQYTFTTSTSEETLYSKYYSTIVLPNQINGETIKEYAVYNDNTNESTIINPGTFSLQDSGYRFYAIKNNENIVMYFDFNNALIHVDIAQSGNYTTWSNAPVHITETCPKCGVTYSISEAWNSYYWNNNQWNTIASADNNYSNQYSFNGAIELNRNLKLIQSTQSGSSVLHVC